METERLRQFCVVVECGSVRKAAELLGMSHGGLSKAVAALGSQLGVDLLAAEGRGITVTDAGRRVYEAGRELLGAMRQFEDRVTSADERTEELRIGTFEVFSTYFLGELMARELPGCAILVRELLPGALEAALAQREVDIGITYFPVPHAQLEYDQVGQLEMAIFGRPELRGTAFAELPFCAPAIPVVGSPTGVKGLDGWPDHEHPRRVLYRVDMMESALELSRRGLGVVFLPRFVARLHNATVLESQRLVEVAGPRGFRPIRRAVYLVRRKSSPSTRMEKRVARCLRRVVTTTPSR